MSHGSKKSKITIMAKFARKVEQVITVKLMN